MDRSALQERFGIIGTSQTLRRELDRVRQIAKTEITVLIEGESGVGKELFAQAIHDLSPRRHKPLLIVNCGAIPEGLIESELFGNEKGAYTGATERRSGYFEEANNSTIFLDEIGEMPTQAQVRLLRVLENGEFSRVGSSTVLKTDARIIAATNKELGREVQAGRFREDLYYRLSTVILRVPPLRERKEDIMPIFEHFQHRFAQQYNTPVKRLDDGARQLLLRYRWPGNIRELRNVAEQTVVLHQGNTISAADLQPYLRGVTMAGSNASLLPVALGHPEEEPSGARERELIYRALLELRLEMRDLKEQVGSLVSGVQVSARRNVAKREQDNDFVILRDTPKEDYASLIEDVPYEIENEADALLPERAGMPVSGAAAEEPSLPTLEDAEQALIARALERFDGNRRQTARALGISERTLYRKIKDLEEED